MSKRIFILTILFLLLMVIPVSATTGLEYLNGQDLREEEALDFKTLSLLVRSYSLAGNDTTALKSKISSLAKEESLIEQGFSLLATGDIDLAREIVAKQKANGSWDDEIYSTAIISYALLENNLELTSANNGVNYLKNLQSKNGSWDNSIQNTAVSLLALSKANASGNLKEKATKWLLLQQGGNGSWGNNINTAWASLALLEGGTSSAQLKNTIRSFRWNINVDGGWGIYPGEKSNPCTSALVYQVLKKYDSTLAEVVKAQGYISSLITNEAWVNRAFAYYNLSEICYLLRDYPNSMIESKYSSWLRTFSKQNNHDYLARKISALAQSGGNTSLLVGELIAAQNIDGGWGFAQGYDSNPWDTTLVLRALLDTSCNDLNLYAKIIYYLQNNQNTDGSFALKNGGEGHIYLTTLVAEQLVRLEKFVNYPSILERAKNYLATKGTNLSLLEKARLFDISFNSLTDIQIKNTLQLFKDSKLTNGSWENDSLTTASVLRALKNIKADLSISHTDITFAPQKVYINDQVTITANIHNRGYETANNVEVKLYKGKIADNKVVGTTVVNEILAGESKTVIFKVTAEKYGSEIFNVIIDSANQITELDETNNLAAKAINVVPKLDLTLSTKDIMIGV